MFETTFYSLTDIIEAMTEIYDNFDFTDDNE